MLHCMDNSDDVRPIVISDHLALDKVIGETLDCDDVSSLVH